MGVEIAVEMRDERTITIPKSGSAEAVERIGSFFADAAREGYTIRDERTVEVPVPANIVETQAFADFCVNAADDNYALFSSESIMSGHQRDQYVVGQRMVFRRIT